MSIFKKERRSMAEEVTAQERLAEAKKRIIDSQVGVYEDGKLLEADKRLFEKEKELYQANLELNSVEEKAKESSRLKSQEDIELDARIEYKEKLLAGMADGKDLEIKLLKETNSSIIKVKDEVIEMLKAQVEILTAKLTEIKISDAHIHVQAAITDSKK